MYTKSLKNKRKRQNNVFKSIQDAVDCFRFRAYEVEKKSGRVDYK